MTTVLAPSRRTGCPAGHACAPLADGGVAMLRPLHDGEVEPLVEVFDGLSPESRHSRFLVSMPRLPSVYRRSLAAVDGHDRVAWLAVVDGRPAGIARYVRTAPDLADIAFEVVDAHHGRGVGSALVDAVSTVALARGITWLEAVVAPGNTASVALLTRLGMSLTLDDGLLTGCGALRLLEPSRVDRSAVLALAEGPLSGIVAPAPGPRRC